MRRTLFPLALLPWVVLPWVGGCVAPAPVPVLTPLDLVAIPVFGRSVEDIGVSAATGRDCSVVRLDARNGPKTYCAPSGPPRPQPVCTRTIGVVTCWADPSLLPPGQRDVAQTPAPTADQLRYRALPWPKDLLF